MMMKVAKGFSVGPNEVFEVGELVEKDWLRGLVTTADYNALLASGKFVPATDDEIAAASESETGRVVAPVEELPVKQVSSDRTGTPPEQVIVLRDPTAGDAAPPGVAVPPVGIIPALVSIPVPNTLAAAPSGATLAVGGKPAVAAATPPVDTSPAALVGPEVVAPAPGELAAADLSTTPIPGPAADPAVTAGSVPAEPVGPTDNGKKAK